MTTAKRVFDWERQRWIGDRTKEKHNIGKFDVDFFAHRKWNYDASSKTLEKAKDYAGKITDECKVRARVVDSETGKVLFETSRGGVHE